MAQRPIDVYLNDHLAGATFGADLARRLEAQTEATDFHPEMSRLAEEIEADLDTLTDLMKRIGAPRNPSKQVTAWVAEKASRVKLAGLPPPATNSAHFSASKRCHWESRAKLRCGQRFGKCATTIQNFWQQISMSCCSEPSSSGRSWRPSGSLRRNDR